MKVVSRCMLPCLWILLSSASFTVVSLQEVPADHVSIEYVGRFDFTDPQQPAFMYSASMIRTGFTGTSIAIKLSDDSLRNWYTVKLDDSVFSFKTESTAGVYTLAKGLAGKKHRIEVSRRTEWHGGNTRFGGFIIDEGEKLYTLPKLKRTIEFIGDSYTCGYGNEGKSKEEHFNYATENSYLTYGALVARALDANFVSICRSGIGMYQSYGGEKEFVQPKLYDEVVVGGTAVWDYRRNRPDVVVIALGSNDLEKPLDSAAFVDTYIKFVSKLRGQYPQAKIVCAAGPEGPEHDSRFQSYVRKVVDYFAATDRHVYYFYFGVVGFNGSDWHPNLKEHEQMAAVLLPYVKKILK